MEVINPLKKNFLNQEIRNLAAGSFRIRPELNPCFQANIGKAHRGGCLADLGDSHGWISKSQKPGASALRLDSIAGNRGDRPEASRSWR